MVGRKVQLQGLISRPELNGKLAEIIAPENDNQRVTVQLVGTDVQIRVAADKLHEGGSCCAAAPT